jgi:hypothetical protein
MTRQPSKRLGGQRSERDNARSSWPKLGRAVAFSILSGALSASGWGCRPPPEVRASSEKSKKTNTERPSAALGPIDEPPPPLAMEPPLAELVQGEPSAALVYRPELWLTHLRLAFPDEVRLEQKLLLKAWLLSKLGGDIHSPVDLPCAPSQLCVSLGDPDPSRILAILQSPGAPAPSEWRGLVSRISSESEVALATQATARAAYHLSLSMSHSPVPGLGPNYFGATNLSELGLSLERALRAARACITSPGPKLGAPELQASGVQASGAARSPEPPVPAEPFSAPNSDARRRLLFRENSSLEPGHLAVAFPSANLPSSSALLDAWRTAFAREAGLSLAPRGLSELAGWEVDVPATRLSELLALAERLYERTFASLGAAPPTALDGPDLGACFRFERRAEAAPPSLPALHFYFEGPRPNTADLELVPVTSARGAELRP